MGENQDEKAIKGEDIVKFFRNYIFNEKTSTIIFIFFVVYLSLSGVVIYLNHSKIDNIVAIVYYLILPLLIVYSMLVIYFSELKLKNAFENYFIKVGISQDVCDEILLKIYNENPKLIQIKKNLLNWLKNIVQVKKDDHFFLYYYMLIVVKTLFFSFIGGILLFFFFVYPILEFLLVGIEYSLKELISTYHFTFTILILIYIGILFLSIQKKIIEFSKEMQKIITFESIKRYIIYKNDLYQTISLCYWLFTIGTLSVLMGAVIPLTLDFLENFTLSYFISDGLIQIGIFVLLLWFIFYPDYKYSTTLKRLKKEYVHKRIIKQLEENRIIDTNLISERNEIDKIPNSLLLVSKVWITIFFFLLGLLYKSIFLIVG